MNPNNKSFLLRLIDRYFEGSASKKETADLFYFFLNNQKINHWPKNFQSKNEIEEKILKNIHSKLEFTPNKKEIKTIPFYKRSVFKYVVAASVILLISLTFIFDKKNTEIINPVIVNNNIKAGTDKAFLTLENGTNITLEKGHSYVADNIISNGDEIIYNASKTAKSKTEYNYLTIPRGGQYFVKLSDGTQVWLNSESKIKYPVNFIKGETRRVELVYGEAYFDVSPSINHNGSNFKVLTGSQEVEVLGTEFNISAYQGEEAIYTTLIEGKVSINNEFNKLTLKPEEQSIIKNEHEEITVNLVDVKNVISWRRGIFSFKGKPLKDIMKVLSRWYDFDVVFEKESLKLIPFKGVLGKDQTIEEILLSIKNASIINSYEINNKTIILK